MTALLVAACAHAQVNVLTANYDNGRTNANLHETILNPSSVNGSNFGKLGTFPLDGSVYAQALYVSGVQIAGQGTRNVVYVATMHNSVYAIDGDAPQSTTPLWKVNLGPSVPSAVLNLSDILPEVGILSTPVIDPSQGVIYAVADTLEGGTPSFWLHALSLADGSEKMNGPVLITASLAANGIGSVNGLLSLDATQQLQRPGLALANGTVYLAFGSHGDIGSWHGWMISYDASNLQHRIGLFNTSPNGLGSSIWQAGRAPVVDDSGNIYVVTGNGDYDGQSAFGESVLRLSGSMGQGQRPDGTLNLRAWFTPENWNDLNDKDQDFGSSGAILVPGTNLLLAGSKAGTLYMIPGDSMGRPTPADSTAVQAAQVNKAGIFDIALWATQSNPAVYVAEPYGAVKAYQIMGGRINSTMLSQFPISSMFTGLAVSANGGAPGTGILWLTTGRKSIAGQLGTLHALDASDLSKELWNSDVQGARDGMGRFAKFVAPTVANGKVYVPTFSNALAIYGLLSGVPGNTNPPRITSVVNGASFLGDAVAAGEYVAIFGANLGSSVLANLQWDASGLVSSSIGGTQVFFDGVPAPLIYASSTQVGAIVPFAVSGLATQAQVAYRGQTSSSFTLPVLPAAPSLISADGTGGGPGVINADGTLNVWWNTAAPGSIVTLYATGAGQTVPASVDGAVTKGLPYPTPVLPVTVSIDGQSAEVLYAGAAPTMVAGVLQVNVRIPDTVWGYNLQVFLQVGDYSSPNALTISVL